MEIRVSVKLDIILSSNSCITHNCGTTPRLSIKNMTFFYVRKSMICSKLMSNFMTCII